MKPSFCTEKETSNKMKTFQDEENICIYLHISNKGLISKTKYSHSSIAKTQTIQLKNGWGKVNRHFSKGDTQVMLRYMKNSQHH